MVSRRNAGERTEMGKANSEYRSGRLIRNKNFDPEKYGMMVCPCCNGHGYIQNSRRQCCPKCGGFGFIKREAK